MHVTTPGVPDGRGVPEPERTTWAVRLGLFLVIGTALLAILVPAGAAGAQDEAAQSVRGRVQNRYVEDGERITEPVAGVRITLEDASGTVVAEAVTGEDGTYVIAVQQPGDYTVRLDTSTLPEGLGVEEGAEVQQATIAGNQSVTRVFFLGEDTRSVEGKWSILPQTLANGLKLAMIIAITSIGLSLVFGTTGLSNFAHGEMVTFGALAAFVVNADLGWHLLPAVVVAAVLTALFGGASELIVWRPLRHRGTSLTSMMIVSIGLALALRYVYLYQFGGGLKTYRQYTLQRDPISIGPIDLAPRSVVLILTSTLVIVAVALFLLRARFGKAIRAVSDNPDLASASGIDADRVILVVWLLGGGLAGLGGVFYGLEYGVRWDMGFTLLLLMFAAVTLGGLGNPFGALVGALVIGMFVELWTWLVPGANDLKNVGALTALIIVLLVKPQGLLGSRERIG